MFLQPIWESNPIHDESLNESTLTLINEPIRRALAFALFRLTDRITSALSTRVLFVSRADRDLMVTEGLVSESKAVWTGNGAGAYNRSSA